MDRAVLNRLLERRVEAHKYDFGHVLVVGGSPGMVGAPLLAGEAALRTGAGLVTIASYAPVIDKLERRVREIMTLRIPDKPGETLQALADFIRKRKVSVVVIGPGQNKTFAARTAPLLQTLKLPVVIDAGALAALPKKLSGDLILTPHAGEFERLLHAELPTDRVRVQQTAKHFAITHHVSLILKGHYTLVAHPDGTLYQNATGNPGLATAGTGDVLSGVIAGLLAQGLDTKEASEAGVYLHGLAGDLAAVVQTQPGMIALDVIDQLPSAYKKLTQAG